MIEKKGYRVKGIYLVFLLAAVPFTAKAQNMATSKYGVPVVRNIGYYVNTLREVPEKELVELQAIDPTIRYELRYASTNNFTGKPLYPRWTHYTYMRKPAALALGQVQVVLRQQKLGLKIFDAYRPYQVTERFWELIRDERYVANPSKGSGHNRGLAVDLTLVDLETGEELDMGTGFDDFTDSAHHTFTRLRESVLKNRETLRNLMVQHGFQLFETEWWHYSWPNDKAYEVLDLSFPQLRKLAARQ